MYYDTIENEIKKDEKEHGCTLAISREEFELLVKENPNTPKRKIYISLKCKCGEIFKTTLDMFKNCNKKQCNKCGRKRTSEQFSISYNEIFKYINGKKGCGCKLITTEQELERLKEVTKESNSRVKLNILCSCGKHTFYMSFSDFKTVKNKTCKECYNKTRSVNYYNKNRSITYEKAKRYIEDIDTGKECKLITSEEEFNEKLKNMDGSRIPLKIECKCGNEFNTALYTFKQGQKQCPDCGNAVSHLKRRKTFDEIKDYIEKTFSEHTGIKYYLISDKYEDAKTQLHIIDENGYKYTSSYNNLLSSSDGLRRKRLLPFYKSNIYTIENIKLWLSKNAPQYMMFSNDYINVYSKLEWQCPNGHTFKMSLDNFKHGYRCSYCNMSYGEQIVLDWINVRGYKHIYQYEFNDCKGKKRNLPFDFAILNDDDTLNCLIEYDGELHYEVSRYRFSESDCRTPEDRLHEQQYNDKLKDKYCKEHNIKLIRIPYWEKNNIFTILDNEVQLNITPQAS